MLTNQLLIYDDNCPLCEWYSSLFVRYHFLPGDGRKAFSEIDGDIAGRIDLDKGRNQIPLVNTADGTVLYGIDAMLEVLSSKCSIIKPIGRLPVINAMLRKLYKFISYNRKVIVAKKCGKGQFDCAPDLNVRYRVFFMLVFLVINTLLLYPIYGSLHIGGDGLSMKALQGGHFALIGINLLLASTFSKTTALEYLGQVNMLAFIALMLLVPVAILNNYFGLPELVIYVYLGLTTLLVFKEYLRRMHYAGILENKPWVVAMNLLCMNGFVLFVIHS